LSQSRDGFQFSLCTDQTAVQVGLQLEHS
jgi:hypothetical protein